MATPISNLTSIWTNSSQTYNAIGMDVDTSAYADGSMLFNLKNKGESKFSVDPSGNIKLSGGLIVGDNFSIAGSVSGNISIDGSISLGDSITSSNTSISNTVYSTTRLATGAEFIEGTSRDTALGVADTWDAAKEVSVSDATTINFNFSSGINFNVNLRSFATRTLDTPTNMKPGQSGYIRIRQGNTAQVVTYGSGWNFSSGVAPSLSTGVGNTDILFYQVLSTSNLLGTLIKNIGLNY